MYSLNLQLYIHANNCNNMRSGEKTNNVVQQHVYSEISVTFL